MLGGWIEGGREGGNLPVTSNSVLQIYSRQMTMTSPSPNDKYLVCPRLPTTSEYKLFTFTVIPTLHDLSTYSPKLSPAF